MRMTVLKHAKPQLNENLLAACQVCHPVGNIRVSLALMGCFTFVMTRNGAVQSGDLDIAVRMIQAGADLLTGKMASKLQMQELTR